MPINLDALLIDAQFSLIEREYIKRAKKRNSGALGEQDYQAGLQMLVGRIFELMASRPPSPFGLAEPFEKAIRHIAPASDDDRPLTAQEVKELEVLDKSNTVDERAIAHGKILEIVQKAFEQPWNGNTKSVEIPRSIGSVSELEPYLKAHGIHFGEMNAGLFPAVPGVTPRSWLLTFTR